MLLVPAERVRSLVASDLVLSDLILRAYLMRRALLIEQGTGCGSSARASRPTPSGCGDSPREIAYRTSGSTSSATSRPSGCRNVSGISPAETPVVIFGGNVLRNPINTELARLVGLPAPDTMRDECDVVVVGTGPAGLAAVLYSDGDQRTARRQRAILETSRPGVFAAGDVRSGSVKRVASAVGEGSMAIRQMHEYFGV